MEGLYLFGILLLLAAVLLISVKFSKEGFATSDAMHDEFSKKYQKKFNHVGAALVMSKNEKALGQDTRGLFGNIQDTMDKSGKHIEIIDDPYPLEGGRSGMFDTIDKCETVKTADCSAFDNASFSKDCGLCLDIGTNSQDKPQTGGLVLTAKDKEYGKSQQKGNFLAPYDPTVGTCPAGRMVANKAECLRLQKQLTCERNGAFNTSTGCSQCYDDTTYRIVDPSTEEGLIVGSGSLMLIGSGTLVFAEAGQSNNITVKLTGKPYKIQLLGPEYNNLTFKINAPSVPKAYDPSVIYSIDDLIIFNGIVYRMIEGIGAPGYDPANPTSGEGGTYPHWENKGAVATYTPSPPAFIGGYLTGQTASGIFTIDLYRIILNDAETGRKPRTMDSETVDGVECTKMGPGFGKKKMSLTGRSPFTFVDPLSQEASMCPNSPFVTMEASSNFLQSDPCYKKGSGPGKFSNECLQATFLNNGCVEQGSGYPTTAAKASAIMLDGNAYALKLSEIADKIYASSISAATGVGRDGTQLSIGDWSRESVFCTGVAITSPCDVSAASTGPLSKDCLVYLWDNQGQNKKVGATYGVTSSANSLFEKGKVIRFCSKNGTISPVKPDGTVNPANLSYWQKMGGVASVKAALTKIHADANSNLMSEDVRKLAIQQCYGITPNQRPAYTTSFKSPLPLNLLKANTVLASGISHPKNYDYTLSFDITPYGTITNYASILRITNTTGMFFNRGDRNPLIVFTPNTTSLYVILGDDGGSYNWGPGSDGFTFPPLPLNKKSTISITATGPSVRIEVGTSSQTFTQPTARVSGENYSIYASDNFFPPANAMIENMLYTVNSATIFKPPPAPVQPFGPGEAL